MKSHLKNPVHPEILERFTALQSRGKLAHAYLFTGSRGIGKTATAFAIARLVNCENGSADVLTCDCPSCLKIVSGNHPDVVVIRREKEETVITAEQIRGLISRFELRPLLARVKVAILENADEMSLPAANIFLKTLEEPPAATLLILTTTVPARILKTIFSRCHEVRFFVRGNSALAEHLKNEYDVDSVEADILAKFAQGSPERALELGREFLKRKNAFLDEFVLGRADEALFKKLSADKELARESLGVLLAFYRDILALKSGVGEDMLFNRDRLSDLRRFADKYNVDDVRRIIGQAVKAIGALNENFNVKIALTLLKEII